MTPLVKGCSSVVILIAAIVALFIFGLRSCLSKYDERSAIPPALYFKKDSSAVLISLVKYSKATSYSQGRGVIHKTVSNSYYIQSNDAASGAKISSKEIGDDVKRFPEKILGSDGRHAWVFLNELLAFDPFTLQKVADIEVIEAKNPALSGMMPLESEYYKFDDEKKAILFTSNDGKEWQLDSKTFIATAYEAPAEEKDDWGNIEKRLAKDLEQRIKKLKELSPSFTNIKINQDTINGTWWGLYSGKEMAKLNKSISFSPAYEQDQRRQLYSAKYDSSRNGYTDMKEPLLFASSKASFFLDGGFLADKQTALPVRLHDPESHLLLHKTKIGDDGDMVIGRIDQNGLMVWQMNIGSNKWIDYMIRDNRLILFANDNKEVSSSECTLLMIIDLKDGKMKQYDYFKDETRK